MEPLQCNEYGLWDDLSMTAFFCCCSFIHSYVIFKFWVGQIFSLVIGASCVFKVITRVLLLVCNQGRIKIQEMASGIGQDQC